MDANSPHYRWEVTWIGEDIEKLVKTNLPMVLKIMDDTTKLKPQRLYNLAILSRDSSQRVKELKIGFTNDFYIVTGEQARRIFKGDKILYSSLFKMDLERNPDGTLAKVICKGAGYGHGVGMCQYSARAMALEGYSYKQILNFFYRGTSVKKMY